MKAKKWVLVNKFDGQPKDSDIQLMEEELPEVKDGEILGEAVYLSVDPYMRPYMARFPEGTTMIGQQLMKVIESKNKDYPVSTLILAMAGWRSHTVLKPEDKALSVRKIPDMGPLPISLALGILGMPGCTAYFGVQELCEPKEGETLLVNAAAGAVGSIVGQIGKIKGLRVVGGAGTDDKCKWLKDLGFDYVFNYKTADLDKALKEGAPNGIDCYFDNVGGDFTMKVLFNHMNLRGRIAICGSIAAYNSTTADMPSGPYPWPLMIQKQLKMEGFLISRWMDRIPEAIGQLAQWIVEGKLKYREHVTDGFENMRSAFYGMLKGENTGKAVVNAVSSTTQL